MIISKCSKADIDYAIIEVNARYNQNIKLNNYECLNGIGTRHRVTLRVLDSHGPGAHLSRAMEAWGHHARRTTSACWHIHGQFFDALPSGTKIQSRGITLRAGNHWLDFNVGSIMYPVYASESCLCEAAADAAWHTAEAAALAAHAASDSTISIIDKAVTETFGAKTCVIP